MSEQERTGKEWLEMFLRAPKKKKEEKTIVEPFKKLDQEVEMAELECARKQRKPTTREYTRPEDSRREGSKPEELRCRKCGHGELTLHTFIFNPGLVALTCNKCTAKAPKSQIEQLFKAQAQLPWEETDHD